MAAGVCLGACGTLLARLGSTACIWVAELEELVLTYF